MKKKIAIIAGLLLIFIGFLSLIDETALEPDPTDRHEISQLEAKTNPLIEGIPRPSEDQDFIAADEKSAHPSTSHVARDGSFLGANSGSDVAKGLPSRAIRNETSTQIYFIRSGAILENRDHSPSEEEDLRDATENALSSRKLSGPIIVFDADAVPPATGDFLIPISEKLDLTEAVKREYQRLEVKRTQPLTRNRVKKDALEKRQLMEEFEALGGTVKPKYVDVAIDEFIKIRCNGDQEVFLAHLEKEGVTLEQFRKTQEEMIILQAMRVHKAGLE